ncbi:MAG: hypothetical protein Q4E65_08550 [Clostridia bacterium]|nr:hypothetical protein [Clostridia bacterium]
METEPLLMQYEPAPLPPQVAEINAANIEYIAMMCDVDLEVEDAQS